MKLNENITDTLKLYLRHILLLFRFRYTEIYDSQDFIICRSDIENVYGDDYADNLFKYVLFRRMEHFIELYYSLEGSDRYDPKSYNLCGNAFLSKYLALDNTIHLSNENEDLGAALAEYHLSRREKKLASDKTKRLAQILTNCLNTKSAKHIAKRGRELIESIMLDIIYYFLLLANDAEATSGESPQEKEDIPAFSDYRDIKTGVFERIRLCNILDANQPIKITWQWEGAENIPISDSLEYYLFKARRTTFPWANITFLEPPEFLWAGILHRSSAKLKDYAPNCLLRGIEKLPDLETYVHLYNKERSVLKLLEHITQHVENYSIDSTFTTYSNPGTPDWDRLTGQIPSTLIKTLSSPTAACVKEENTLDESKPQKISFAAIIKKFLKSGLRDNQVWANKFINTVRQNFKRKGKGSPEYESEDALFNEVIDFFVNDFKTYNNENVTSFFQPEFNSYVKLKKSKKKL